MSACSFALHGSTAICWRTPRHARRSSVLAASPSDYAQKAAALAPENAEAQLSVAISYGKMLPFMDTKSQFQASPRIKAYAEKAIQLDPENDLAWHVLGRWHRTLSDVNMLKRTVASFMYGQLPKTTTEKAVSCFEKALEINPRRLMHYIELGRAYAQMGKTEEARRLIEKGLSMPNTRKRRSGDQAPRSGNAGEASVIARLLPHERPSGGKPRPGRHIREIAIDKEVMPELGADHGHQAHFHRHAGQRTGAHLAKSLSPVTHRGNIKIPGALERLLAQQLSHEWGLRVDVKTVQWSAKDHLATPVNGRWQPAFREQPQ